jgi:hypothetical protein
LRVPYGVVICWISRIPFWHVQRVGCLIGVRCFSKNKFSHICPLTGFALPGEVTPPSQCLRPSRRTLVCCMCRLHEATGCWDPEHEFFARNRGGKRGKGEQGIGGTAHRSSPGKDKTGEGEGEGRAVVGPAAHVPIASTACRTMLACPQPP